MPNTKHWLKWEYSHFLLSPLLTRQDKLCSPQDDNDRKVATDK